MQRRASRDPDQQALTSRGFPGDGKRGLVVDGRQIPREGCPVLRGSDTIGTVSSGNFSPVLERGIALAFVPPDVAPGDALTVDVRGRNVAATVAELPFVRR